MAMCNTILAEDNMATLKRTPTSKSSSPLMVRMDAASKAVLAEAAELRGISVSDYVRTVMVPLARKEVKLAIKETIFLDAKHRDAFMSSLSAPVRLTKRQKELGRLMQGKS
jgi:uncharacterized protein (DUF1778 family)